MTIPITPAQFDGFRPGRLWSICDIMRRFHAPVFAVGLSALSRAATAIRLANYAGLPEDTETDRQAFREAICEALPAFAELPLSRVIRAQIERLGRAVDHADGNTLALLTQELHENVVVEMTSAWFLMIEADKREAYEQRNPPFGDVVAKEFMNAVQDIAAASRCFALDEWTACIFHLMRVLEHGLRALAIKVALPPDAMAHENWKNVIDQIESKIREMEKDPKTPAKIARIGVLSSAATQFRYFKDAWRNHVSHSGASYDQHEGERVWTHVKAFMQHMAANP